ncbi:MAG: molecular chaperone TorD family protein [Deltaproteobacteria bacterium]|nr:molecular chaperone TorD family protein [Deltaproteobacteria bacterium]
MKANDTYLAELARATTYKALAECYYPPGELTLQHVRQLGRDFKVVCPPASEAADRMEAALRVHECVEELAIDHARLFVGPFALLAPPYGSVYLEGDRRLMGGSTQAVGESYREVGLEVAAGFNGTPDHIAAELEFMHFLVVKELEAVAGGDLVRAQPFRQTQKFFLERHLAAWVPVFTRNVEEQAQTRFYQALAAVTRLFIESDFDQCRGDVPVLVSGSATV